MDQEVRLWDSESMRVIDKYKNEAAILDVHWGMPNMSGIIAIALGSSCVRLIDPRSAFIYLIFNFFCLELEITYNICVGKTSLQNVCVG